MARRITLPLSFQDPAIKPTIDAVRRRLGGRAATEPGAGDLVMFRGDRGVVRSGVVVFVRGEDLDVWALGGVVRRIRRADAMPFDGEPPHEIVEASNDARVFAALHEGQRVLYKHEDGVGEGTLVEKCRFGALVARSDRTVLGVGFRRLWAAPDTTALPS